MKNKCQCRVSADPPPRVVLECELRRKPVDSPFEPAILIGKGVRRALWSGLGNPCIDAVIFTESHAVITLFKDRES